ncbi:MAG: hypothetical protein IJB44_03220 [Clostridia bacterium]|nr:hypothetical protein [Clostridia bacterium]
MDFFIIILSIVFLFVAYPFIRFFIKRLICCLKIKRSCRKNGLKLHAAHFLWFLGLNNSHNCDFYIEASETVLSVKLFGALTKRSEFVFDKDGTYRINELMLRFIVHHSIKRNKIPTYNFRYKYKEDWEIKNQENITLINPVPMDVSLITDKGKLPLTVLGGGEVRSLQTFLARLENLR